MLSDKNTFTVTFIILPHRPIIVEIEFLSPVQNMSLFHFNIETGKDLVFKGKFIIKPKLNGPKLSITSTLKM